MATFTVTNTNDSGAGSLRQAVADANAAAGADRIVFAAAIAGQTVTLTSGQITVSDDVEIDGDSNGDNKADVTISGNHASRIFTIGGIGTDAALLSLTLTAGNSTGSGGAVAMTSYSGTLAIADTTISDCVSSNRGGGLFSAAVSTTITSSLFSGNSAAGNGGGIYANTRMSLTNTTLDGNSANGLGGGIMGKAALTVSSSTITANRADADGADTAAGGGIAGSPDLVNSVLSGNVSGSGSAANDLQAGTALSASHSFFGTAVSFGSDGGGNIIGGDPRLGLLGDHGGTVHTRNVMAGSVLIDSGSNEAAAGLTLDANGNPRIGHGTIDIGATELIPLIVTTAADVVDAHDGLLSLREAVALADAADSYDMIGFSGALAGQTLTLTQGELALTGDVTIDGDITGDHKADVTISGNNAGRIFSISGTQSDVELRSMTLTGGAAAGSGGAVLAGGGARVAIADTTITGNTASSDGGGAYVTGRDTTLSLANCLVSENRAGDDGGGIATDFLSRLKVFGSTLWSNTANGDGGGLFVAYKTTSEVWHCTVVGNQADADGNGGQGGGVYQDNYYINLSSSVFAANTVSAGQAGQDCYVNSTLNTTFASFWNFFGVPVGGLTPASYQNNINGGGDPLLGELLDNGGTVLTMSPRDGSKLIDWIIASIPYSDIFDIDHDRNFDEAWPVDGRGGARLTGLKEDIGAVEYVQDETIHGTAAANRIFGGLGTDTLFGEGGNDTLNGGAGIDRMDGGTGNDTFVVDNVADTVIEALGGGTDTVAANVSYTLAAGAEIEKLQTTNTAGTVALNLTGNEFANTITGNAGDNVIRGGLGADIMKGLGGNDTYVVDDAGDRVAEDRGFGNDTVAALVSYSLAAGTDVERLQTGNAAATLAINLTGNEFANIITGNAGANMLNGRGGSDKLDGGLGADIFRFNAALGPDNIDTVKAYNVADDTIQLSRSVFTAFTSNGTLAAGAFNTGASASEADDRIIYDSLTGALYYDADGSGAGAAVQFARLTAVAGTLTAADFFLIA